MAKTKKDTSAEGRTDAKERIGEAVELLRSLGGAFGTFGGLIAKLGELAEEGGRLSKTGEIKEFGPGGKLRGVYGISIRTALGPEGEREFKVEPFGNVGGKTSGGEVISDVCEPLVDVHEEDDHVLVVAEIPGVSKKDLEVTLSSQGLIVDAERGDKRYHKEVPLPEAFATGTVEWTCRNGILTAQVKRP
ncbi:MAG: Hsp20/alpha crystallin family protein [Planctomycetia bacterium]|nr:Hsp20/alpha crystallin family protein [Planctomycetia bacterium]